jgi:iron(III) transport system substrate-binding protein
MRLSYLQEEEMKRCAVLSLVGALVISASLFAAGQQQSGGGQLVIYSPNSETLVNLLIPAFEKETGIKVSIISAGTGEVWKRIESERNSPNADVVWGGQVANYNPDLLDEYVSKNNAGVLPQYKNIANKMTPYCLDGSVLLVNKNLIGNIKLEGYADLLNPALKGKMIMGDPTNSSSAFAQLTNILYDMGGGDYLSDAAWNYVKNLLVQLDGKTAQSSSIVHKGVADGEYTVGLTYEDPSATYVRDGASVNVVYMKEGVSFLPALTGIIKGCKNKESAQKWVDFIVSKAAQDIIGTQLTVRPVRDDATLGNYMRSFTDIKIISEDIPKVDSLKTQILDKYRALRTQG